MPLPLGMGKSPGAYVCKRLLVNPCYGINCLSFLLPSFTMPKPKESTIVWAKESLRGAGLRATAARVAVIRRLADVGKPQSHAEMVHALGDSGFDQSTLFRCLNELADANLVARLDLGDQLRRFELAKQDGAGEAEHAHFMCVDCGTLTCLDGFAFKVTPERGPRRKALGTITEVLLRGHCGACVGG